MGTNAMLTRMGIHAHSQDLRKEDGAKNFVNRRGWMHWGGSEEPYRRNSTFSWQLTIGRPVHPLGCDVEFWPDEEPLKASVSLWPFALYVGLDTPLANRVVRRLIGQKYDGEREIAVHLSREGGGTIRWSFWHPIHSWSSKTPRWRNGHFCPLRFLLGDWRYSSIPLESLDAVIAMPEGEYPATVKLTCDTWVRPRFPFLRRVIRRAHIEVANPPEFAGKGENSWDCDDDAIYSMTTPASSVGEAVTAYRDAVLRNRKRYGNPRTLAVAD